tara:strand:- start:2980 stop:4422 length:1443 start_codon:yes stop_codon:yes gene_type:complete
MKICPVIISGGSGTRLWPISRSSYPKQFLNLIDDESLFKKTLNRSAYLKERLLEPIIVAHQDHRFLVSQQVLESKIEESVVILEPQSKNTAPAVTLAAAFLESSLNEDCLILVSPSDHFISSGEEFIKKILESSELAISGSVCIFGVKPTYPNTGYGYIQAEKRSINNFDSTDVISFQEKPDIKAAQEFVNSGDYLWNSGVYLFTLSTYMSLMDDLEPKITKFCRESIVNASKDFDFIRPEEKSFSKVESISIDNALTEKIKAQGASLKVKSLDLEWSDIGSIQTLSKFMIQDKDMNSIHGDVIQYDSTGSFFHSSDGLIATLGLKDMVVIKTSDAVLVAPKSRDQEVRILVDLLKSKSREEADFHKEVTRPWGSYEVLYEAEGFKIKVIKVNPGAKLSLQMHKKRSEHWVVVKGVANVTCGEDEVELQTDQSTYIPVNTKHSLGNTGKEVLEIIEVQTGSYLGEDDIIRFEDLYGRINQ